MNALHPASTNIVTAVQQPTIDILYLAESLVHEVRVCWGLMEAGNEYNNEYNISCGW